MLYKALHTASHSYLDFVERQLAMGLDVAVEIPPRPPAVVNDWYNLHGLPVSYDPRVSVREWVEDRPGERWPRLVKEYQTPAGILRAEVERDAEWRWGNHVPFLDDYLETRSKKFIVTVEEDLERLEYLLAPPTGEEIRLFREESQPVIEFARRHGLLVTGGWGVGADLLGWVYGLESMIFAAVDQPAFLQRLLEMVARWNRSRMEVVLDTGVDLYIKRAWYESCDFWSPRLFKRFLALILKEDAELAHQAGAKLGYIMTSSAMPLLGHIAEAGVDALIGVDPRAWNLAEAKRSLQGRVCLWGGVNGHLTVEQGDEAAVREEVRTACQALGPDGFILSPVDNVREDTPISRRNVAALIDEWRKIIGRG